MFVVVAVLQRVLQVRVEMVPRGRRAEDLLRADHQPGELDVVAVGQACALWIGHLFPVGLTVETGFAGVLGIEIGRVQTQAFFQ